MRYQPYVAVLSFADSEPSIRTRSSSPTSGMAGDSRDWKSSYTFATDFSARCDAYRSSEQSASNQFDATILRPIVYDALGHTDVVAIVLAHDIKAFVELTAQTLPVEYSSLAFCPEVESLFLKSRPRFLCDVADFFRDTDSAPPLLALTSFKASSFLTLELGSLFLESMFRAVVHKLHSSLEQLRGAPPQFEITADDIHSTRFAILDPQGADDALVICQSSNYSIAMSAVAALRDMTVAELLDCPGNEELSQFFSAYNRLSVQLAVSRIATRLKSVDAELPRSPLSLRDNHVFVSTYTTLGFKSELLYDDQTTIHTRVRGVVDGVNAINISPGHAAGVDSFLAESARTVIDGSSFVDFGVLECDMQIPGRHSKLFSIAAFERGQRLVKLATVISLISKIYNSRRESDSGSLPATYEVQETGIQDVSTQLSIPIPIHVSTECIAESHLPTLGVLSQLVAYVGKEFSEYKRETIDRNLERHQMPWSFHHTLNLLFDEFLSCLGDPTQLDSVIDLIDFFTAIHSFIASDGVTTDADLEDMLDAVQNAMHHRIGTASIREEIRDRAFDFRGGLQDLISAVDVPLRCGLGIFRRSFFSDAAFASGRSGRRRVSAVTQVRLSPVAKTAFSFRRGDGVSTGAFIGNIAVDVDYIVCPERLPVALHEVGHAIFEILGYGHICRVLVQDRVIDLRGTGSLSENTDQAFADRLSLFSLGMSEAAEIFAEFIPHLVIFGCDWDLYLRNAVDSFTNNIGSSIRPLTSESLSRGLVECYWRWFIITYPFRQMNCDPVQQIAEGRQDQLIRAGAGIGGKAWGKSCKEEFQTFVCKVSSIVRLPADLEGCRQLSVKLATNDYFESKRALLGGVAEVCWTFACRTVIRYVESVNTQGGLPVDQVAEHKDIDESIKGGNVVRKSPVVGRDSLFMASSIMRSYMSVVYRSGDELTWERRMRSRVATLRSLWHLSSVMRGRRLYDLLEDAWGGEVVGG